MDTLPTSQNIADFTGHVWHADCLDLLKALPDKSVDLILTDPPYGTTQAHYDQHELDFAAIGAELFRVIKPSGAVICTAAQPFTSELVTTWKKYFRYEWIWHKTRKTNFLNAKKMPLAAHESVLVFGHKLPRYFPQMVAGEPHEKGKTGGAVGSQLYREFNRNYSQLSDEYYPDTVQVFQHDKEISSKTATHPNQKPLALWEYLMLTYSLQGEIVLDPFAGSATTAIACLNLDRKFICGDSHLPYVEMSRQRIAAHDPFVDTPLKNGLVQKSLFASTEGEGA